jgi:hypothetical protein
VTPDAITGHSDPSDTELFWIPPQVCVQVRDGGRWVLVYHDGDETEPLGRNRFTGVITLPTGPQWRIVSAELRTPNVEEITGV